MSDSLTPAKYEFHCIVYIWNEHILANVTKVLPGPVKQGLVDTIYGKGSSNNCNHVAILIDDINASEVDMVDTIDILEKSGFGATSPAADDSLYPSMTGHTNCHSDGTDFVNIFLTVMKALVWKCWQLNIDLELNAYGWGMDLTLSDICNTTLGIIDDYKIVHIGTSTTYKKGLAQSQMETWTLSKTGMESRQYFSCSSRG